MQSRHRNRALASLVVLVPSLGFAQLTCPFAVSGVSGVAGTATARLAAVARGRA
jgi:hypothetical protein